MKRMSTPTLDDNRFDGLPPKDETGNVDLSLVDCCLERSPAERLTHCEQAASFILSVWRSRGLEQWSSFVNSSDE